MNQLDSVSLGRRLIAAVVLLCLVAPLLAAGHFPLLEADLERAIVRTEWRTVKDLALRSKPPRPGVTSSALGYALLLSRDHPAAMAAFADASDAANTGRGLLDAAEALAARHPQSWPAQLLWA